MPHITIKLWPGKTEEQKKLFAARVVKDAIEILGSKESSMSVAIEEIAPDDWSQQVYRTEIAPNLAKLYVKPGYEM